MSQLPRACWQIAPRQQHPYESHKNSTLPSTSFPSTLPPDLQWRKIPYPPLSFRQHPIQIIRHFQDKDASALLVSALLGALIPGITTAFKLTPKKMISPETGAYKPHSNEKAALPESLLQQWVQSTH